MEPKSLLIRLVFSFERSKATKLHAVNTSVLILTSKIRVSPKEHVCLFNLQCLHYALRCAVQNHLFDHSKIFEWIC
jgi:hypothetical protein